MKKVLILLLLIAMVVGCSRDTFEDYEYSTFIPEALEIQRAEGLRLEKYIVTKEVQMNVKLTEAGTYRLKIKDISGKLVSQEKLKTNKGDNLLKTYTSALPKSSYTITLEKENGTIIGSEVFAIKN